MALIIGYGQSARGGPIPEAFLQAEQQGVHRLFRGWLIRPSTGPMAYGLIEEYDSGAIQFPTWVYSQPSTIYGTHLPVIAEILPQLGKILWELAIQYSGIHDHFQTILLQTDNRDWRHIPGGPEVARHAYHRTRFYKEEKWVAVRYLTGPEMAYGDRNHYWLAPTMALAMHILQEGDAISYN